MDAAKVLVVEDETIIAEDLVLQLTKMGYEVAAEATSGEEAIRKVAEHEPDIVLMDIKLQGAMGGVAAAEQISLQYNTPVIYMTSYSDDEILQKAKTAMPYGYLLKPFNNRELHATIQTALYKHRLELQIRSAKEEWERTFDAIPDLITIIDEDFRILKANKAVVEKLNIALEDLMGKNCFKLFHDQDAPPDYCPHKKLLASGGERTVEADIETMGRSYIVSVSPVRDMNGETIAYIHFMRDVTEQKKIEEDLVKARNLESLGVLAGGIAHDLNNIHGAIMGNIELAKMDLDPSCSSVNSLNSALNSIENATKLVNQLLTFSLGGELKRKPQAVKPLVVYSCNLALQGSAVTCLYSLDEELYPADVDRVQIDEVLQNILQNAKEAMPHGGEITIAARNVSVDSDSALFLKKGNYVEIKIQDQGAGIARDALPKIFDPYFSTKDRGAGKGMGLGLAICHAIIAKHGGLIRAESIEGQGAAFYIYLPAYEKAVGKVGQKGQKGEKIIYGNGRILVLEDEEAVSAIMKKLLLHLGYEPEFVEKGEDAVDLYKENFASGSPFDAVILDLTIRGGMGGKGTLFELQKIDPEVKAIVSSGYSDDPIMLCYKDYGFKAAAAKPCNLAKLSKVLDEVLNKRSQTSEGKKIDKI